MGSYCVSKNKHQIWSYKKTWVQTVILSLKFTCISKSKKKQTKKPKTHHVVTQKSLLSSTGGETRGENTRPCWQLLLRAEILRICTDHPSPLGSLTFVTWRTFQEITTQTVCNTLNLGIPVYGLTFNLHTAFVPCSQSDRFKVVFSPS